MFLNLLLLQLRETAVRYHHSSNRHKVLLPRLGFGSQNRRRREVERSTTKAVEETHPLRRLRGLLVQCLVSSFYAVDTTTTTMTTTTCTVGSFAFYNSSFRVRVPIPEFLIRRRVPVFLEIVSRCSHIQGVLHLHHVRVIRLVGVDRVRMAAGHGGWRSASQGQNVSPRLSTYSDSIIMKDANRPANHNNNNIHSDLDWVQQHYCTAYPFEELKTFHCDHAVEGVGPSSLGFGLNQGLLFSFREQYFRYRTSRLRGLLIRMMSEPDDLDLDDEDSVGEDEGDGVKVEIEIEVEAEQGFGRDRG